MHARMQLVADAQFHSRVAFLPYVRIRLSAPKAKPFKDNPITLGDHLRKRRHELKLQQKQIAKRLKINQWTYIKWETNRVEPETRYWPRIIAILGYDPHSEPKTLGDRLRAKYRQLGLPRKRVAERLKIDEGALAKYDRGDREPQGDHLRCILKFIKCPK